MDYEMIPVLKVEIDVHSEFLVHSIAWKMFFA